MNIAITTVLLAATAAVPVEAPLPVESVARRHAERFIDGQKSRAIVVGVTSQGTRRVWGFGGFEQNGSRVVPDADTVYEIGSITKTFTGTILADLVCDGIVKLDDPVRRYVPDDWAIPRRDDRDITLLHLTTHTSSLPRLPPDFDTHLLLTLSIHDPYSEFGIAELKSALKGTTLRRPIGSQHRYSNFGVGLLGVALAHADKGGDVDRLFQDRLLTPLNLNDTTFAPNEEQRSRMAPPFKALGIPTNNWHFDCLKACGGLRSTANDLLAYAEAAMGQTPSSLEPAFELAMQPWRETVNDRSIGLGWYVQPMAMTEGVPRLPETRLVWHSGGTGGYRTFLGLMPERRCAIVVLSNSTAGGIDPGVTWPVMRALLRETAATTRQPAP